MAHAVVEGPAGVSLITGTDPPRIAQHFGRPGTPNDQAWIETLFGHVKGEYPHLDKIEDPGELERELERVQDLYNIVRLHQSLGYVTPEEEHHGLGPVIRKARRAGLDLAHAARVATRRKLRQDPP
jgi:putative transposase